MTNPQVSYLYHRKQADQKAKGLPSSFSEQRHLVRHSALELAPLAQRYVCSLRKAAQYNRIGYGISKRKVLFQKP